MYKYVLLGLGGAIGTICRYSVQASMFSSVGGTFPLGTLIVNLTGSLVIGFLWGIPLLQATTSDLRIFLFVGVLGGYTTFSAFSLESINLLHQGQIKYFTLNILATNVLGILLALGAFLLSRNLFRHA
jgi:CrcB protein